MNQNDADKIIAAIDRNTEAVRGVKGEVGNVGMMLGIIWLGICVIDCPRAKASPILTMPEPIYEIGTPPMPQPNPHVQYWYTEYVPTPKGVLPVEVFAPRLVAQVASEAVEVPEPGTWLVVGLVILSIVCVLILKQIAMESLREWELEAKRCAQYRRALEEIAATNTDNGQIARKALEGK